MSLTIVYCKQLSDDLIPKIVNRLMNYEMIVEVKPDFSFSRTNSVLQFKFKLTNPHIEEFKEKLLISSFDILINDFDFDTIPRFEFDDFSFANTEIQKTLKDCNKKVSFIWPGGEDFQFRFAFLTSVILTELTEGVYCYPEDVIWYDHNSFRNDWHFKNIQELENNKVAFQYKEFKEW